MPARGSRRASPVSSEFGLIRRLQAQAAKPDRQVALGIGDDTAILKTSPTEWTLMTTDLLAEGVHFDLATSSCEDIGYRAAIANLSDIAAMGGTPVHARRHCHSVDLFHHANPTTLPRHDAGLRPISSLPGRRRHLRIKHGLFLSITLTGVVRPGHALLRSEARVGDRLYVTGTLGDSRAGLGLLSSRRQHSFASTHRRFLLARHHRPSARIAEGQWLVKHGLSEAAIDLSDGLTGDLRHICEHSHVGADVLADALPISPACRAYAAARRIAPQELALQGGEDYELLFTVPADRQARFDRLAGNTTFRFTCIGTITPKRSGLRLRTQQGLTGALPLISYEHFRRPS